MKRFLEVILLTVCALIVAGIIGFVGMIYSFKQAVAPKTSPAQYSGIVKERKKGAERYAFLPDSVDPKAEKVAFYHLAGFFQGGDSICLRLKLPEESITQIVADLEKSGRIEVRDFGEISSPLCYPEFGIERASREEVTESLSTLPEGFRIFLFESDLEDIKRSPNHNFLAFTAVSVARGEVVYFVDWW